MKNDEILDHHVSYLIFIERQQDISIRFLKDLCKNIVSL